VSLAVAVETNVSSPHAGTWPSEEAVASRGSGEAVYCFRPLTDARWNGFVQRHPRASVFHSSAWLEALSQTYGYDPVAYTTSVATEDLENAIVFCRVNSWLTGRRLVSLPFSDHCEPLVEANDTPEIMARIFEQEFGRNRWRYIEIRPLRSVAIKSPLHLTPVPYAFHQLDLSQDIDRLFRNFHKNSVQRKILRAEREGLIYREGATPEFLDQFYRMFKQTRERHRVPPQPRKWFVNLMRLFGSDLKIRIAYQGEQPVAAMITLRHKDTLVYKYGCSDPRFNNLGGMHLLYWRAIQEAAAAALRQFDFGRTDADQQGLITFKNRWGATQSLLTYSRYGASESSTHFFDLTTGKWKARTAKYLLSHLPSSVISTIGQVLYRHVG
jgi:CelD/BcsL family acetyltransferase involved in cellulose biosynthesis